METMRLLVGGREAFDNIIANINNATKHIKINMFIWRDDDIGNEMALALLNAANRGVRIHISKDRLGMLFEYAEEYKHSFFHHNLWTRWYVQALMLDKIYPMNGKNSRVSRGINPNYTKIIQHNNITVDCNRVKMDHSKYYIFDHEVLIIGGINIEDKEVVGDVSGMAYHDYMVEIRNRTIVKLFKERLYGNKQYNKNSVIEFIYNRAIYGKKEYNVKASLIDLLNSAKDSVDIVMAYIGDPDINDSIERLICRGVQVRLYLSAKANLQHDLNMKKLKELMIKTDNNIEVYLSDKMIHAKLVLIDQEILTVGSTNLNNQAMEGLLELNIVMRKSENNKEVDTVFTKLDQSIEVLQSSAKRIYDQSEVEFNAIRAFIEGLV